MNTRKTANAVRQVACRRTTSCEIRVRADAGGWAR